MKRTNFLLLLLITLISLFSINRAITAEVSNIQLNMRTYSGVDIPAGVVIPVLNMQEISTETCPEGYKTKFVSTNDLYIEDTKVIPENSEFYGYIEKINEPIVGTNASMRVKITKLILPDGYELPVKAYVYTSNDNLIGGELTPPSEWTKMPHYQTKFQKTAWNYRGPTLQIRPGGPRSMGVHTKINAGERQLIILVAPLNITHTVTD
jgi:hypothetical protein